MEELTAAQNALLLCEEHRIEETDMYCKQCRKPICMECFKNKHIQHNVETIAKLSRKLKNNHAGYLRDLTTQYETKKKRKKRQMQEVKCRNGTLLSKKLECLKRKRKDLHRRIDSLVDEEEEICHTHTSELLEKFRKVERKHVNDCEAVQKMLNTFEKTTMTGLDLILYYEELSSRVKGMEDSIDAEEYCDRLIFQGGGGGVKWTLTPCSG